MKTSILPLNRVNYVEIERELLNSLYHGNSYTMYHIADIFGCSHGTIWNRMKEYGIQRRNGGHIVTDFTFNARQKEIFEGCMLGDGGLVSRRYSDCYFRNADMHEDYLIWLQKQLGVEHISSVKPVYRDGFDYEYTLDTRVIPSIRDDHKRWYPDGIGIKNNIHYKTIPKDIELTPIKMLFWFIGDGGYVDGAAHFYNFLVFDDWMILSNKICRLLDVDVGISINKFRKDDVGIQRYYLRLNKVVTSKFFDMVDSLDFDIPKCYLYKFGR